MDSTTMCRNTPIRRPRKRCFDWLLDKDGQMSKMAKLDSNAESTQSPVISRAHMLIRIRLGKLERENREKDRIIKRLRDQIDRHAQESLFAKGNRKKMEDFLKEQTKKLRQELKDAQSQLLAEKVRHLEFMLQYKPMVILEKPGQGVPDEYTDVLQEQVCSLRKSFLELKQSVLDLPSNAQTLVTATTQQIQAAIAETHQRNEELFPKYRQEIELRRKYYNELMELRGNIRVFCRVRPPREAGESCQENAASSLSVDSFDDCLVKVNHKGRHQEFDFDKVFQQDASQSQVFEEVKALVNSVLDGFNICIFAYGQTGSGKTHTMEGPPGDPGINQRALRLLFDQAQRSGWDYSIEASVMEVYNETIRDLLSPDPNVKLEVKLKPEGGLHVPGLVHRSVTSLEEVNEIFSLGRRNRATEVTNMNEHSSRSHCLLCVTVRGVNTLTDSRSFGRLNLVDLAGSERLSKSLAEGSRLKETQSINKSLSSLGDVINALKNKHAHVPYRNSKLTYLLQESLGGDSKTLMILQVSPDESDLGETACTLGFGQRVRLTELGTATKKADDGKSTPRKGDNSAKTTPTAGVSTARPQNLAKSCFTLGKQISKIN